MRMLKHESTGDARPGRLRILADLASLVIPETLIVPMIPTALIASTGRVNLVTRAICTQLLSASPAAKTLIARITGATIAVKAMIHPSTERRQELPTSDVIVASLKARRILTGSSGPRRSRLRTIGAKQSVAPARRRGKEREKRRPSDRIHPSATRRARRC
jgi:hypothetical protein